METNRQGLGFSRNCYGMNTKTKLNKGVSINKKQLFVTFSHTYINMLVRQAS